MSFKNTKWINLALDTFQWWSLVNTVHSEPSGSTEDEEDDKLSCYEVLKTGCNPGMQLVLIANDEKST
jgi:hypothetical protein